MSRYPTIGTRTRHAHSMWGHGGWAGYPDVACGHWAFINSRVNELLYDIPDCISPHWAICRVPEISVKQIKAKSIYSTILETTSTTQKHSLSCEVQGSHVISMFRQPLPIQLLYRTGIFVFGLQKCSFGAILEFLISKRVLISSFGAILIILGNFCLFGENKL